MIQKAFVIIKFKFGPHFFVIVITPEDLLEAAEVKIKDATENAGDIEVI